MQSQFLCRLSGGSLQFRKNIRPIGCQPEIEPLQGGGNVAAELGLALDHGKKTECTQNLQVAAECAGAESSTESCRIQRPADGQAFHGVVQQMVLLFRRQPDIRVDQQ